MSKKSFNEAVEMNDLELLFRSTKKVCSSVINIKRYKLPNHLDIEDITQEAVIKLLKALDSFDSTKSTANTFCNRVINNLIIDYVRSAVVESKKVDNSVGITSGDENFELGCTGDRSTIIPQDNDTNSEYHMVELLASITKTLTDRQRELFMLRQEGYTMEEIAKKLSISRRTAQTDWSRVSQVLLDLIY